MTKSWLPAFVLLLITAPLQAQPFELAESEAPFDAAAETPSEDALQRAIQGRWLLDTFETEGEVRKLADLGEDDHILGGMNELEFVGDALTLADDAPVRLRDWKYVLDSQSEPPRFTMTCPDLTMQGTLWSSDRDKPAGQLSIQLTKSRTPLETAPKQGDKIDVKLNYHHDPTDPIWLQVQIDNLREIGGELLAQGNETQQRTAWRFLQYADAMEAERKFRLQAAQLEDEAEERRKAGDSKAARDWEVQALEATAAAEFERANRVAMERMHDAEDRQRDKVRQLVMRAALLREEGDFDLAEEVEQEVKQLLCERDPDLHRLNELKRLAAESRLEGKVSDAEDYDRQAAQLLLILRQRYGPRSDNSSGLDDIANNVKKAVPNDAAAQEEPATRAAPAEAREIRIFQLQNASAAETMRLLEKLGYSDERCSLACDVRLNALVASGPHDRLLEIEALLVRLDEKSDGNRDAQGASAERIRTTIHTLSKEYEAAEEHAAELARQWREEQSKAKPSQQLLSKLEEEVQRETQNAFVLRQQMHQARIDASRQELEQIEQRLRGREALAKEIIARRVADLLRPEYRWEDESGKWAARSEQKVAPLAHGSASEAAIEGVITATSEEGLVEISVGSDDGVRRAQPFDILRGATYVGRVEVTKVEADKSIGRLLRGTRAAPIRIGDRVLSELRKAPAPQSPRIDDAAAVDQVQSPREVNQVDTTAADDVEASPETVQVSILGPQGVKITWPTTRYDDVVAPAKANLAPGERYLLRLEAFPGQEGLTLQPTLELRPLTDRTRSFTQHNAIPLQFTQEDIDQARAGNLVTKVVYLPDPEFTELALAGVETLVATRVDVGVDPVAEAERRGSLLAILRFGNRNDDKEP